MNLDLLAQAIGRIHTNPQARAGLAVNQVLNWRNWLIGAYIVEFEQGGEDRAEYGGKVMETLASRFRRKGFTGLSLSNLRNFRQVALSWPRLPIHQTLSGVLGQDIHQTLSGKSGCLPENQLVSGLPEDGNRQTLSAESCGMELCADKDTEEVHYATAGLDNTVFVSRYLVALPSEEQLKAFLRREQEIFSRMQAIGGNA